MIDKYLIRQLASAGQFDVHKWSDYPEIKLITNFVFEQVCTLRKGRNPKARIVGSDQIKKHLRILLIDLYVASLSPNPWRGISKHKPDYQKQSRYRKIYLTYDYLIPLVDDLTQLGYIEQQLGFHPHDGKPGFRTRIKATKMLVELIQSPDFGLNIIISQVGILNVVIDNPEAKRETVILRDDDKNTIEYEDTDQTILMRNNLEAINKHIAKARVTLNITDEQLAKLDQILAGKEHPDREHIDFSRKSLFRAFNGDFMHGGRFYGGWWIGLPKEYRKYIEINHKLTVEVDYSAHHIRILYAIDGLNPPDDPYNWDGCPFDRDTLKQVFLILINANSRASTLNACAAKKIHEPNIIVEALEAYHKPIAHYFHTGIGTYLQFLDSMVAEQIMLRMKDHGAVVLPVHDSFIVRNSYEDELREVMDAVFVEQFGINPKHKSKETVLDLNHNHNPIVNENLENLIDKTYGNKYSKYKYLWGLE